MKSAARARYFVRAGSIPSQCIGLVAAASLRSPELPRGMTLWATAWSWLPRIATVAHRFTQVMQGTGSVP